MQSLVMHFHTIEKLSNSVPAHVIQYKYYRKMRSQGYDLILKMSTHKKKKNLKLQLTGGIQHFRSVPEESEALVQSGSVM